jgi:hypothetical protein
VPAQAGVVRVRVAKGTATVGVCVAVIGNINVTKVRITRGITTDCLVLPYGLQRQCPPRGIVRIYQRKKKTLQTRSGLSFVP